MTFRRTYRRALVVALGLAPVAAPALAAQGPAGAPVDPGADSARDLSIDEALRMAESQSEAVRIARAGVSRASADQYRARSAYLPQIYGSLGYTRTLRSQFSALADAAPAPAADTSLVTLCTPAIPRDATPAEREAALAAASTQCTQQGGLDFSRVGFGAKNQYVAGLSVSQSLFAGGREWAQTRAAAAGRRSADIELTAQRAQLALDVTQAYYDAALTDRLVAISESSLVQTQSVLRQTQLARQVGNTSEFELLRAQVTRDNQLPQVIQQRGNRDVAYLRLKQLLNLPLDQTLRLTTVIDDTAVAPDVRLVSRTLERAPAPADTIASERATVRQTAEAVRVQRELVRVARAGRLPSLNLSSGYQRLFFPPSGLPDLNQFSENWTVGVSASIPIFTGGRLRGDQLVAEANLREAEARLDQTRELAALDTRVALNALRQAESALAASQGTSEQASRAYSIAEVRYREGLSTQVELSESRLLLSQAQVNRALAARDLQVARVKLRLLRDLPLSAGGVGQQGAAAQGGAQSTQQQQQQQQQRQQQQQQAQAQGQSAGGFTQAGQLGGVSP